jgi:hypothetical protein
MPSGTAAAVSVTPYSLTLSLETESYMLSKDDKVPRVDMFVNNESRHNLVFPFDFRDILTAKVEYKPLTGKPLSEADWVTIAPAFRANLGLAERGQILSGQKQKFPVHLYGCPMLDSGYYRLTVTFAPTWAIAYDGDVSQTPKYPKFNLSLSSKPLLIKRDENGFSIYPPIDGGTPIPPQP